jgi:predicted nucleic acid-binding protein
VRILPKKSPYYCLWEAFLCNEYDLCYTTDILQEYEEILLRFYSPKIAEFTIGTILKSLNTFQITPYYKWNLISADYDDNKFADCAISAGADYLVTNDRHFDILKSLSFPSIKVVDIETFKRILIK